MSIKEIIASIIYNKRNYCCLCLHRIEDEAMSLEDQVIVNISGAECGLQLSDIMQTVLGDEICNYAASLDTVCLKCMKILIDFYTFIVNSQKNIELMTNILNNVLNSVEDANYEFYNSKALYLSLDLDNFTSKQYYDCHFAKDCSEAAKRLYEIENPKQIGNFLVKTEHEERKPSPSQIPISEFLYDLTNPDMFKCKICLKLYPTICSLRNHFVRVHAPKQFQCSECPKCFGSQAYLNAHMKESHYTMICSECGKTFYNKYTFKEHELSHYMSIVCPDCGRTYKTKMTFKKHKENNVCGQATRAHPSEAKFTCDYCNKKYTQKMSLRVHIQYEHGNYKGHVCEWCGKKYWAKSRLKAHIVKHTRERNFHCTMCNGKFVTKESLLYHTRIHTGEKPYKCPQCDCRFLSSSRRADHVKRHHNDTSIECDICHIKFASKSYLKKHKQVHNNFKSLTIANDSKVNEDGIKKLEAVDMKDWPTNNVTSDSVNTSQLPHQVYDQNETNHGYFLQVGM